MLIAPRDRVVTLPEFEVKKDGRVELEHGIYCTLGWEAIHWATKYLKQPDGEYAGERWEFLESQVRWELLWYAVRDDGRWLYYHGVRRYPKGAGKSPFAAVSSLIELLAPVRISRFDDRVLGGCVGRPVGMPLVQIAATSQDQANVNTMRMVQALLPAKSRIRNDYDVETGKTIFHIPGGGQLMIITSSPTTEEGALVTFAILDQTESFLPNNGGVLLSEVLDRNVGKSGQRMIETSNAWQPGKESVAESTFDAWVAQEEGRLRGHGKILYDSRMAPLDIDFDNEDDILRGVDVAYGDAYFVDTKDIVQNRILSPRTTLDISKRFYLNWPTAAMDAWTTQQMWGKLAKPEFLIDDGDDITMGFDGSRVNDATALIGCHVETGFTFSLGIWETENGTRPIPVQEVDSAIALARKRWNVRAFFADVNEWEEHTKISWRRLFIEGEDDETLGEYDGLYIWAVPGGRDPQPVAWDMRSHVGEFTQACEMVLSEIESNPPGFIHDGDSYLGRHVVNARRRPNRWGVSIGKEAPKSVNKIDGCVAMIMARHARRLVLASKLYKEHRDLIKKKSSPGAGARIWSFS
jgi:hypothetical protein